MIPFFLLISCKSKPETDEASPSTDGKTAFTTEQTTFMAELSSLDCEIYVMITEALMEEPSSQKDSLIRELRSRRMEMMKKVSTLFPDSLSQASFSEELDRLGQADDYCQGLKQTPAGQSAGKDVSQELNIRKDAEQLAELNCRILAATNALKDKPDDTRAGSALERLKGQKKAFLASLVKLYGPEILKDKSFRRLVQSAQDSGCDFTKKVAGAL